MTRDVREILNDLYTSYAAGDFDKYATLIHPDIDWIIQAPMEVFPFAGHRRGRPAVIEAMTAIAEHYPLERYEREALLVDGDRVAILADASVRQRATGRTLRFHVANFLRFRDDMLVELREFTNTFDVVEQALGRWLQV
ncbi:MAG TPA: nuclear transport factor 2 family protein [Pseudolabrys sp.]|nr:nuclear transport factor 2 family protein [Pseudolabrys sp.]